jgi:hypothetical protein
MPEVVHRNDSKNAAIRMHILLAGGGLLVTVGLAMAFGNGGIVAGVGLFSMAAALDLRLQHTARQS